MEVEQCVLCQTETKESLSSVKSGLANLIPYAKDFKNTALENHLVAIKIEKEKKKKKPTKHRRSKSIDPVTKSNDIH